MLSTVMLDLILHVIYSYVRSDTPCYLQLC